MGFGTVGFARTRSLPGFVRQPAIDDIEAALVLSLKTQSPSTLGWLPESRIRLSLG
jgi:hypothetical protein